MRWLLALSLMTNVAAADDLTGRASVIDGDTIEIQGSRIRLSGIDAPESSQLCRDKDSKQYRCGQQAANALSDFIANRVVACIEVARDRYKRVVAVCTVDGVDLADWLVRHGHAMDWPRYSQGGYASAQREARAPGAWHLGREPHRAVALSRLRPPWRSSGCLFG